VYTDINITSLSFVAMRCDRNMLNRMEKPRNRNCGTEADVTEQVRKRTQVINEKRNERATACG